MAPARRKSSATTRPRGARGAARAAPRTAAAPAASAGLARVAKGHKPQYFSDPATDKLLWMTVTLMEELAVTRDRLDTVERLLARKRVLPRAQIEAYVPTAGEAAEKDAERSAFVERVMRIVQAELEELHGREPAPSEAEILAAVAS